MVADQKAQQRQQKRAVQAGDRRDVVQARLAEVDLVLRGEVVLVAQQDRVHERLRALREALGDDALRPPRQPLGQIAQRTGVSVFDARLTAGVQQRVDPARGKGRHLGVANSRRAVDVGVGGQAHARFQPQQRRVAVIDSLAIEAGDPHLYAAAIVRRRRIVRDLHRQHLLRADHRLEGRLYEPDIRPIPAQCQSQRDADDGRPPPIVAVERPCPEQAQHGAAARRVELHPIRQQILRGEHASGKREAEVREPSHLRLGGRGSLVRPNR